jgi:DNA-binding NarL/FixJ family response regulator
MTKLRLAVVDDHGLFRKGVIELLRIDPAITVVADGATGNEAIAIARDYTPDVMLMDVEMPGPGAEKTLTAVLHASPGTAVLILTMHDDVTFVRSLVKLGAAGYMLKSTGYQELISAVHSVARGDAAVTVSVSRATLGALVGPNAEPAQVLSPREMEVLRLVALAQSNAQIAKELYVSQATVKRHLTNIYTKIGASGRIDALIKARAAGLIDDIEPTGA